jgi:hypothetical protein
MLAGLRMAAAALTILLVLAAFRTTPAAGADAVGSPDVEQLLGQLRSTLIRVQGEIANRRLPELKNVQINLQTGIKISGGGKVTFFVVSLGDTLTSDKVQTIKMTLVPPKVTSTQVSAISDFSKDFAEAIIAVAETIAASSTQKPELNLSSLSASMKFVSETKMEGGVSKVQLLPVSLDLGGNVTPTNTHEAVLNFGSSGTTKSE